MGSADSQVLLINPPLIAARPDFGNVGVFSVVGNLIVRCINPGILSIASYLDAQGYKVRILDLSEESDFSSLLECLEKDTPWVAGISCSTGFNYLSSIECSRIIRQLCPETLIIAGGQHIGPLGTTALRECPWLDVVVKYEGELVTEQLLEHYARRGRACDLSVVPGIAFRQGDSLIDNAALPKLLDLNDAPFLNYELYPNFRKFNPYVEESRGCPHRCRYCLSNFTNLGAIRVKRYDRFLAELDHAVHLYGTEPLYPILASTFGINAENTLRIAEGMRGLGIRWNTEFRVDNPWPEYLGELYHSGLRILSVGLESASPEVLHRMGRTRNPPAYIEQAQKLIERVSQLGDLMLKVKIMFYAGETPRTIRETLQFLLRNADGITEMQFSPVFAFPGAPFTVDFPALEAECGCSLVRTADWEKLHLYPVNLSRYFGFREISAFSNTLERIFSPEHSYYDVNQYTYGLADEDGIRVGLQGKFFSSL